MAFVRTVPTHKQKKDAEGKKLCLVCEGSLPSRRSSYCSDECAYRNTPNWMRNLVRRRDKGICAICGINTYEHRGFLGRWEMDHIIPVAEGGGLCGLDGYRTLCPPCHGKESGALRKRLNERKRIDAIQRETGLLFDVEVA